MTLQCVTMPDSGQKVDVALYEHGQRREFSQWLCCVHGLTRNAGDFDFLADTLSSDYHVICPDMPGRGDSPWLEDKSQYNNVFFAQLMALLLQQLNAPPLHWVGTSMGGLIGMLLAATQPKLIKRLVLNDVGARIPAKALLRLRDYVGKQMSFANRAAAEAALRVNHKPFGLTSEAEWQHLFDVSLRENNDGSVSLRYDPAIALPFQEAAVEDVDLWPIWELVKCPVLIIRGRESDLLEHDTAVQMQQSRPDVTLVELEGIGHAPALYSPEQIGLVREWLNSGSG